MYVRQIVNSTKEHTGQTQTKQPGALSPDHQAFPDPCAFLTHTSSSPHWVQRLFPAGLPLLQPLDHGDHLCLLSYLPLLWTRWNPPPRWTRIQSEPKFAVSLWVLWVGPLDFHILPFLTAKFLPLTILSQLRSHQSPSLPSMSYWYVLRGCFFVCVYLWGELFLYTPITYRYFLFKYE